MAGTAEASRRWRERNPATYRESRRRTNLARWGITVEQYDELLAAQGGCCAICKRPASTWARRLNVDHDHVTGEIRGILRNGCNGASLGTFRDDVARVEQAIAEYEERVERLRSLAEYLRDPPARGVL